MKKAFSILPTIFIWVLCFSLFSCSGDDKSNDEPVYNGTLNDIIYRKFVTPTDDNKYSEVKRAYIFNYGNGVICDWCDGQWEGYEFEYSIDAESQKVTIHSETYSCNDFVLDLSIPTMRKDNMLCINCVEHMNGKSQNMTLVEEQNLSYVIPRHEFNFNNGDAIDAKVLANPQKYGFDMQKATMLHVDRDIQNDGNTYLKLIEIWSNSKGYFIIGNSTTDNVYRKWNNYDTYYYAPDGILYLKNGMEWNADAITDEFFEVIVNTEEVEIDNARINDYSPYTLNSSASSYSSALGFSFSGSFTFDVWYDNFSWSDINVYTDASWLWIANEKRIFNYKGDVVPDRQNKHYDNTSGGLYFCTTENNGYERTGHIYVYINTPQGKTYSKTITVIQKGKYSDGGTGGDTGGDSGSSHTCTICYGTGKCTATNCISGSCAKCGGTGIGTMGNKCNYCNNGRCRSCGGTGKCKYCGGDGKI